MVFVFDSNTSRDASLGIDPKSFRFLKVVGGKLLKSDWKFSGRSATSRRTITASVTKVVSTKWKLTGFTALKGSGILNRQSSRSLQDAP